VCDGIATTSQQKSHEFYEVVRHFASLSVMAFELHPIPGDQVRVPDPQRGVATVVSRYRRERAVLLHPDDFHRLDALDALVADVSATDPLALGDAAAAAHRDEDTPGEPVTDPALLDELFG
jgi:hypothetical protein